MKIVSGLLATAAFLVFANCGKDRWMAGKIVAIKGIRSVHEIEHRYWGIHGRFASLTELQSAGFTLPIRFESKGSQPFEYSVETAESGYVVHAWGAPRPGKDFDSYYSDESGVIRYQLGFEMATARSSRIDGDGSLP